MSESYGKLSSPVFFFLRFFPLLPFFLVLGYAMGCWGMRKMKFKIATLGYLLNCLKYHVHRYDRGNKIKYYKKRKNLRFEVRLVIGIVFS